MLSKFMTYYGKNSFTQPEPQKAASKFIDHKPGECVGAGAASFFHPGAGIGDASF
jgi:hypothetical protein